MAKADASAGALLAVAVGLARQAGALLLELHATRPQHVATKSSLTDMVTEIDRASERLIVEGLLAARPDDGILGEEGSARDGTSGAFSYARPRLGNVPAWLPGLYLQGAPLAIDLVSRRARG